MDSARCVLLQARQDMAVDVERDADGGVAETLAHDFWVYVLAQQVAGMRMTKIVKPDAWQVSRSRNHGHP